MGERGFSEGHASSNPVLDVYCAAWPISPNSSGAHLYPTCNTWTHLWTFLPCKRKGNGWCRCILNFLEEASSKGTHYCLSLEEGLLPSVCREGLKGSWKTF